MRGPRYSTAALLSLPALSWAVQLADFQPVVSGLPTACNNVYHTNIDGCSQADFTGSSGCSTGCIKALNNLTSTVRTNCANDGISGENVLVAFMAGSGPESICSNSVEVASEISSLSAASAMSTTAQRSTATMEATTTTSESITTTEHSTTTSPSKETSLSSETTSTSSSGTSSSATNMAITTTSTSIGETQIASSKVATAVSSAVSGLNFDTSSISSPTGNNAKSTSTTPAQYAEDGSGGGSPFDTQSSSAVSPYTSAPLALVVALAGMTLFGLR